jgi:hypothetical protein
MPQTPPLAPDPVANWSARQRARRASPGKQLDRNLLIATWSLREFGRVTANKWLCGPGASPKPDVFSVRAIAEVVLSLAA